MVSGIEPRLAGRLTRCFRFQELVGSVRIYCSFPGGAGGNELELLTPLELSRILKLHSFTVIRLAREGKLPPVPSERQRVEGGFSADPPRQVFTAGRGGGSAKLCGGKVGGSWRFLGLT